MGRLYPRMRERPPEFTLNAASHLFNGLQFVLAPDTSAQVDRSSWRLPAMIRGTLSPKLIWWQSLSRYAYEFAGNVVNCFGFGKPERLYFDNVSFSIAVWAYKRTISGDYGRILTNLEALDSPYPGIFVATRSTDFHFYLGDRNGVKGRLVLSGTAPDYSTHHYCGVFRRVYTITGYVDGAVAGMTSLPEIGAITHNREVCIGNFDPGWANQNWNGFLTDIMLWSRCLTESEIAALADPSNVDLRVGNVPLILPPRRRFWPVVSEQAIPKMVPWHLFQHIGV